VVGYEIAIKDLYGCKEIGVFQNGSLLEYYPFVMEQGIHTGDIYRGKVSKIIPGLQAAFVDLGEEQGFLYVDEALGHQNAANIKADIRQLVKVGQEILVQVVKEGVAQKKPRITRKISLSGEYLVLLPESDEVHISKRISQEEKDILEKSLQQLQRPKHHGVIIRSKSAQVSLAVLQDEYDFLEQQWEKIVNSSHKIGCVFTQENKVRKLVEDIGTANIEKIYTNHKETFELWHTKLSCKWAELEWLEQHFNWQAQKRAITQKKVPFSGGGYLVIDETEAMVVIDVNSGHFSAKEMEDTFVKVNCAAAKEIAKQLMLRNLGGIIIVDFIDMQQEESYRKVEEVMRKALLEDRRKCILVGWSQLGLMEITRQKQGRPLSHLLQKESVCCNAGKTFSDEQITWQILNRMQWVSSQHQKKEIHVFCSKQSYDMIKKCATELDTEQYLFEIIPKEQSWYVEVAED